jgi:hypothetical protein
MAAARCLGFIDSFEQAFIDKRTFFKRTWHEHSRFGYWLLVIGYWLLKQRFAALIDSPNNE